MLSALYIKKSEYGIAVFDPEMDEEKVWFVFECPHSSLSEKEVFEKSGAYTLLQNKIPLTEKQFHRIAKIFTTYHDSEASFFTSRLPDYQEVLSFFLDEAMCMMLISSFIALRFVKPLKKLFRKDGVAIKLHISYREK